MNMENEEQIPVENTPTVQETDTTVQSDSVGESVADVQQPKPEQNNWNNGRRRIEQRQSMKARIRELENRLSQYEGKDDDYSRFQAQNLQDRIDDMHAMSADDDANDFANHASQFFGDETPQFMDNVRRYGAYVNNNEPDLLRMVQRDYGPILLYEWMQRMDNPQLRQQWLGMTAYEKGRVLDNFYNQIGQVITQYNRPKKNVPVPNGGRQSPSSMPSDDFGIELGHALNRHGSK